MSEPFNKRTAGHGLTTDELQKGSVSADATEVNVGDRERSVDAGGLVGAAIEESDEPIEWVTAPGSCWTRCTSEGEGGQHQDGHLRSRRCSSCTQGAT
jgi:hypothetical protein